MENDLYHEAAHAMQSGVAAKMAIDESETQPKHLRVGINSAHVSHAALASILIEKGLITEAEYFAELANQMIKEKERYETELSEHFNKKITLG